MSYFVGAYASSPNVNGWDPALEQAYYDQLKALPNVQGLEHPFVGSLHAHDDDWFLENIDPSWDLVFTCIPGTMGALSKNPHFGIASDNEAGRQEALTFVQKARDAVAKVNAAAGRQVVKAIQVQTAPKRSAASGSAKALTASLETILSWDWQGAQIVIEHCDKLVEGQTPAKGFLSLEDEMQVLNELNSRLGLTGTKALGIVINWGRSAIETQSIEGPAEHIKQALESNLLTGVMFSGASSNESEYGVWKDTHMPPSIEGATSEPASLLTESEMHRCLELAGGKDNRPAIVGLKIGIRPSNAATEERVTYNRDALSAIERFYK